MKGVNSEMKSILAGWPAILFLVAASLPLPARAAVPDELFRTLKGSVGLSGDITMALKTQDSLAALGRQNPEVVVSAILQELKGLDLRDRKADDYRMALLTVIEGIGPAAKAAVPFLESIVQGEDISEWAIFKAQSALLAINSPEAREIGRAGEDG